MRRRRIRLAVGAVLGVLLVAVVAMRALERRFEARVAQAQAEVRALTTAGAPHALPQVVRDVLSRAGVASASGPRVVRIGQAGQIRMGPDAPWKEFSAVQHVAVRNLGFVWHATMDFAPGIDVQILDQLCPKRGSIEIRLLGAIPLSSGRSGSLQRAQIQRYLTDLAWAPHAIRDNPALDFRALGERRLEVTAGKGPNRASVVLDLDANGDIVRSTAMRPRMENGTLIERRWVAELSRHDELGRVRIPTYGEARWELPTGNFVYFRGQIESIELD